MDSGLENTADLGHLHRLIAWVPDVKLPGDIDMRNMIRSDWAAAFGKLGDFVTAAV